jgi:hypothetical protein
MSGTSARAKLKTQSAKTKTRTPGPKHRIRRVSEKRITFSFQRARFYSLLII